MPRSLISFLLKMVCMVGLTSCQSASNNTSNYSTDMKQFSQLVTLDFVPSGIMWQTNEKKYGGSQLGPNDWAIVAVLEYDESVMKELQTVSNETSPLADIFVKREFISDWFPNPIKDSFIEDPNIDYYSIATPVYPPDLFAKSPLLHGYFFIVPGENLVFLYLHTA